MNKRCGCALVFVFAVLYFTLAVFGQQAQGEPAEPAATQKAPERIPANLHERGCYETDTCPSKILDLPNFPGPADLQDVANMLRSIVEITRVTVNPPEHTIALQGTPEQLDLAERLVNDVDSSASFVGPSTRIAVGRGAPPKLPEGIPADVLRRNCFLTDTCSITVLHFSNLSGVRELQDVVNKLRTTARISSISAMPSRHAIVVKGTPEQLDLAEKLVNE